MATFLEGIESIGQACTIVVLVPLLALVLVGRKARITLALAYLFGASLLMWAQAAGHWGLTMNRAITLVTAALVAGSYVLGWLATRPGSEAALAAGAIGGAVAGWLWRPCVGPRLGDILNNATSDQAQTLVGMIVYTAGTLLPALLLAVLPHAWPRTDQLLQRREVAIVGAAVGAVYAATLALGRYQDLIGELYRISST